MAKKNQRNFEMMIGSSPVLLHVPNGSLQLPDIARGSLVVDDKEVDKEVSILASNHTDTMVTHLSSAVSKNPFVFLNRVSVLAADPRATDDTDNGIVYSHGSQGQEIRVENDGITNRLKKMYYEPYISSFNFFTKNVIANHKRVIIINLVSHQDDDKSSDAILQTDDFHTPKSLIEAIDKPLKDNGYSVSIKPASSEVFLPETYRNGNADVMAVNLSFRKDVYMNLTTGAVDDEGFKKAKKTLTDICEVLLGFYRS